MEPMETILLNNFGVFLFEVFVFEVLAFEVFVFEVFVFEVLGLHFWGLSFPNTLAPVIHPSRRESCRLFYAKHLNLVLENPLPFPVVFCLERVNDVLWLVVECLLLGFQQVFV